MSETTRIMASANAAETIIDARGRRIDVRKPSRRESMRFMRQWGTACNQTMWLGNALVAASARVIDGVPVPSPITADHIESLVERLDDDGMEAIADWLSAKAEEDVDQAQVKETLKN